MKKIKEILNNINYTHKHRKAYLKVEKQLLGKNTISGYMHDIDKYILYILFPKKKVSEIHRKNNRHHVETDKEKDYLAMVIDWECARFTKPDKQLTAYQTMIKYYPQTYDNIIPILRKYNLLPEGVR